MSWYIEHLKKIAAAAKASKLTPHQVNMAILKNNEGELNAVLEDAGVDFKGKTLLWKAIKINEIHGLDKNNHEMHHFDVDSFNADGGGFFSKLGNLIKNPEVIGALVSAGAVVASIAGKKKQSDVKTSDIPAGEKGVANGSFDLGYTDKNGGTYNASVGPDGIQSFDVNTKKFSAESKNITAGKYLTYGAVGLGVIILITIIVMIAKGSGGGKNA